MEEIRHIKSKWSAALSQRYPQEEVNSLWRLTLEHVTGKSRSQILLLDRISEQEKEEIIRISGQLQLGRPFQYIVGQAPFGDLILKVNEHVLIPRPETEELVDLVFNHLPQGFTGKIIDIGTGSGCIPLSLKKMFTGADVYAMDVSQQALNLAAQNAESTGLEVHFLEDSILKPRHSYNAFDVIVSNPPYITENEKEEMAAHVLDHEPHLALFTGNNNAQLFYQAIRNFALKHLKPKGFVFLELNAAFAEDTLKLYKENFSAKIVDDFYGKSRFLVAQKNQ